MDITLCTPMKFVLQDIKTTNRRNSKKSSKKFKKNKKLSKINQKITTNKTLDVIPNFYYN